MPTRPGKILRDHRMRESEFQPLAEPEKTEGGEFQEAPLTPGPPAPGSRVLGGSSTSRSSSAPSRPLPPLQRVTLDEHGQVVPEAKPVPPQATPSHSEEHHYEEGGEEAPPAPAGPPIDQQIIEAAQAQAQQTLMEAQNIAQQMLMQAQQQAQQMVEQTAGQIQQAAEQAQQQAREQGYEIGYNEGKSQGATHAQHEVRQFMFQARDIFVQAIRQRHLMLTTCEPQLARLGTKIAERILGMELTTNREAIVGIVKQALAGLGDRESVSVRVNPQDYEAAKANQPTFERMVEGLRKFEVLADPAIDAGGCSIETNLGNVDARLHTQLAVLFGALEQEADKHEQEVIAEATHLPVDLPEMPEEPEIQTHYDQPEAEYTGEETIYQHEGEAEGEGEMIANPYEHEEGQQ